MNQARNDKFLHRRPPPFPPEEIRSLLGLKLFNNGDECDVVRVDVNEQLVELQHGCELRVVPVEDLFP
jgi:hypothetical protein